MYREQQSQRTAKQTLQILLNVCLLVKVYVQFVEHPASISDNVRRSATHKPDGHRTRASVLITDSTRRLGVHRDAAGDAPGSVITDVPDRIRRADGLGDRQRTLHSSTVDGDIDGPPEARGDDTHMADHVDGKMVDAPTSGRYDERWQTIAISDVGTPRKIRWRTKMPTPNPEHNSKH